LRVKLFPYPKGEKPLIYNRLAFLRFVFALKRFTVANKEVFAIIVSLFHAKERKKKFTAVENLWNKISFNP
jgi:hypothetical protein